MTTIAVTQLFTYHQSTGRLTPGDAFDGGLPRFLERIVRAVCGVGVVLLDRWAAHHLGLPTDALPTDGAGRGHPAAEQARAAGWTVEEIHRWSRFVRHGHEIDIGLLHHIDPDYCPLVVADDGGCHVLDTVGGMDAWQTLAGQPYWGDAGDAVNRIIMSTSRCYIRGKAIVPAWRQKQPEALAGQFARTFARAGFDRTAELPGRWLVGYDATRAYLSALSVAEVSPLPLRHTGRRPFDRTLSGWWLVDLSPWPHPELPAPWGHYADGADVDKRMVWLTTPDLVLLDQLREDGRYGGYTVLDSYTGRADRMVLRPGAERLRTMWDAAAKLPDPHDRDRVRDTIKAGYHSVHAKWRSLKGNAEINRPDWAATLVATARTNTWRRIDRAATAGHLPAAAGGIDTVYYATDDPDTAPEGIVTDRYPLNVSAATDLLGTFRRKYLIDRESHS